MNMKKKIIAISLCAAMAATAVIGGTLAYFTDTATVTNSFTVGNVTITLDEADVNPDGTIIPEANRVTENTYKLIPGKTYTKDPTIHVQANSESCYLFVEVINNLSALEADGTDTIAEQMKEKGWKVLSGNIYYRESRVETSSSNQDFIVFEKFTIDSTLTTITDPGDVTVKAYAVQAEGFPTAADAWEATFGAPTNP